MSEDYGQLGAGWRAAQKATVQHQELQQDKQGRFDIASHLCQGAVNDFAATWDIIIILWSCSKSNCVC
jgi:hypothetical protein